jgi:hypothetical protein
MAIPKLEVPTFELKLPSNNSKVIYRPFLVKEHKTLMMSKESNDLEVFRIVEEIVDICTFKKLNMKTLTFFDIEYIFTQMRAKSIGENLDLVVGCYSCNTRLPFSVNLTELKVQRSPEHTNKFMVTDELGIELKYPGFAQMSALKEDPSEENQFNFLMACVKGIYSTSGDYNEITVDDRDDLKEFLDTMTVTQYEQLKKFVDTMPKLSHKTSVTCTNCGAVNNTMLEDVTNFFV